jgi:hypothetical protein
MFLDILRVKAFVLDLYQGCRWVIAITRSRFVGVPQAHLSALLQQ